MAKGKPSKPSKAPSDYQWRGERTLYGQTFPPYHGTNPLAKYPKIFEYLNYLSDIKINTSSLKGFSDKDKKSLLLIGGTEEIQYGVLWYVWDELRHIIPAAYPLILHKNILCEDKKYDDLITETFTNCSVFSADTIWTFIECCKSLKNEYMKKFIDKWDPEIKSAIRSAVDSEMWAYPEAISLKNIRKSFNANCKYVQNKMERKEYLHEDEIIRDILDIYNHLPRFDILSLLTISSVNNKVWIELAASHMSHTSRWKPDLITASLKQGESIEQFPETFINMFDVIDLSEPAKGIVKLDGGQVGKTNVKSKAVLSQSKSQGTLKGEIPSGTKWNDIEMLYTDEVKETIDVSIKGKIPFKIAYWDISLRHKQSKKPYKAWGALIQFATSENNEMSSKEVSFDYIAKLREVLCHHFGISEDPIPYSSEDAVYKTLFRIKDKSYTEEHGESIHRTENVECTECDELINKPDHNNLDDEGRYICDKCRKKSDDRLSKEHTYNNYPDNDERN